MFNCMVTYVADERPFPAKSIVNALMPTLKGTQTQRAQDSLIEVDTLQITLGIPNVISG